MSCLEMLPSGLKTSMEHESTGGQDIICRYLLSLKAYLSLKKVNVFTVRVLPNLPFIFVLKWKTKTYKK